MLTSDRVSVLLANTVVTDEVLGLARIMDECGYLRVWLSENGGLDASAIGGVIARETCLEIGTAIVPVYSRTPALLSMMAATWAQLGGGDRPIYLGIGAGGQVIIEKWHGRPFELPGSTTRDSIRILRQSLAGERTSYEGKALRSEGFRLMMGPAPSVRIYVGGMGPGMTKIAAEESDGFIVTWQSPRTLAVMRQNFDREIREAGRKPSQVRLVARVYVALTETPDEAREGVRRELVEYLLSPPYAKYFRSVGFDEEVDEVVRRFPERNREWTAAAVSDRLLDEILLVGTRASDIEADLAAFVEAGADEIMIQPVPAERGGDQERTIREIATLF